MITSTKIKKMVDIALEQDRLFKESLLVEKEFNDEIRGIVNNAIREIQNINRRFK